MSYQSFCRRYNALKSAISPIIREEAAMVMFCGEFARRGIEPRDIDGLNARGLELLFANQLETKCRNIKK